MSTTKIYSILKVTFINGSNRVEELIDATIKQEKAEKLAKKYSKISKRGRQ